jgi:hypothetical protein
MGNLLSRNTILVVRQGLIAMQNFTKPHYFSPLPSFFSGKK